MNRIRGMESLAETSAAEATPAEIAVRFDHAAVQVGGRTIWSDVSLQVAQGEFLAVLGPNGVGKSTLVKAALGLVGLSAGSVTVLGLPVGQAGKQIGYLPQRRSFDASLRVRGIDIVGLGSDGERWGLPLPFGSRYLPSRRAAAQRVREVIETVGAGAMPSRTIGPGQAARTMTGAPIASGADARWNRTTCGKRAACVAACGKPKVPPRTWHSLWCNPPPTSPNTPPARYAPSSASSRALSSSRRAASCRALEASRRRASSAASKVARSADRAHSPSTA